MLPEVTMSVGESRWICLVPVHLYLALSSLVSQILCAKTTSGPSTALSSSNFVAVINESMGRF